MTAGDVMDRSAALLNDRARSKFTYVAQLPYLNMALDELLEALEENDIPITRELSRVEDIAIGTTTITVPTDLVEIVEIAERDDGGSADEWIPMERTRFLPDGLTQISELRYWTFQDQEIRTLGATAAREVQIKYIAKIQTPFANENDVITIINSRSFLVYRNAGLCAEFIGENPTRASSLNDFAGAALDRMLSVNIKPEQVVPVKRKPFMFAYKRRGS
jgi:hypothetical protein